MITLELRKQYRTMYNPSAREVQLVDVPPLQFLRINGAIEPGQGPGTSPGFQEAMEALYGAAYTLKYLFKKRATDPVDYPVMVLEGLWWVEDGQFNIEIKDNWLYTLMIVQPDVVTPAHFTEALEQMRKKKGDLPAFARLRLETFHEGPSIQVMHIGPYASEPATVQRMHEFAGQHGLRLRHDHHEIYMGDPRRADPAKLKTILRHPVEPLET
ncbi:hypothetical protein EHM76_03090 [bacterium]|nr:MAG: hypothetical protein EHM76_03090 [bacterium]